jgi:hypothetical protein
MHRRGTYLSLDDFGTGYSSLSGRQAFVLGRGEVVDCASDAFRRIRASRYSHQYGLRPAAYTACRRRRCLFNKIRFVLTDSI